MSAGKRFSTKIEIAKIELEAKIYMRLDEFKYYTVRYFVMKLSAITLKRKYSSYDQTSADLINCPLPNSPEKYSHASQFNKHISFMNLEGDTLLQIQKWWDAILYDLCQTLSTNNIWTAYKYLKAENNNIYYFILLSDTHTKFATENEIY